MCSCGRVSGPAPRYSQEEKEVSEVDMRVTVTLLRRHKHGRGGRKVERAEVKMSKDVDEGSIEPKLTKRKGCAK